MKGIHMARKTHEQIKKEAYEQGYQDGENNVSADWNFALTENGGVSDTFPISPGSVADLLRSYVLTDKHLRAERNAALGEARKMQRLAEVSARGNEIQATIIEELIQELEGRARLSGLTDDLEAIRQEAANLE